MFRKNLIMTFLVAVVTSSVAIKTSPIFYKPSTESEIINDSVLFNMDNDYNILTVVSDKIKTKISNIENPSKNNSNDDSKNKSNTTNKKKSALSKTDKSDNNVSATTSDTPKTETTNSDINIDQKTNVISGSNNNVNTNTSTNVNPKVENTNTNEKEDKKTNTSTTPEVKIPTIHYDRTTSIYSNDNKTLIRIEYYLNNKLVYYSYIEQFDATTNSYVEKICKWNFDKDMEILVRTDIYSNSKLIKSY